MKTKKYILIGMCFFLFALLLSAIYHGKKIEYHIRFDGVILSVDDASLTIQGDPQNDVGHRGKYIIKKNDNISIHNSSGGNISFSSLIVGNHVEIHYIDYIVKSKAEQYGLNDDVEVPNVQQMNVLE